MYTVGHEVSAETFDYLDLNLGFLYINPAGYKLILVSISKVMHDDMVANLLSELPILSVMIDTSTDITSTATMAIVFHAFGANGGVEVILYRIIKYTTAETAEAFVGHFKMALEEDGIDSYVKSRCVGFSSDDGPNVVKFRKLFTAYTEHKLASIHCMNHRLELSIKKAWKDIPEIVQTEELINMVYNLFHRSHKKKIVLAEATKIAEQKDFEVKRLIKTRWMATRQLHLRPLRWKPIIMALSEIQVDRSYEV